MNTRYVHQGISTIVLNVSVWLHWRPLLTTRLSENNTCPNCFIIVRFHNFLISIFFPKPAHEHLIAIINFGETLTNQYLENWNGWKKLVKCQTSLREENGERTAPVNLP
jgi:hypothetical protein